jgi:hypothetical protein
MRDVTAKEFIPSQKLAVSSITAGYEKTFNLIAKPL